MTQALTMTGVYLIGHGGLDKLDYRKDIPIPTPKSNEVLVRVKAAGMNNTDINTRIGWYSKKVKGSTDVGGKEGFDDIDVENSSWNGGALNFPRTQGSDICGVIESVGTDVDSS